MFYFLTMVAKNDSYMKLQKYYHFLVNC